MDDNVLNMETIEVYCGACEPIGFILTDIDGEPIPLNDYDVIFCIMKNIDDKESDAIVRKLISVHTSPDDGETLVKLTSEDLTRPTGNYVYGISAVKKITNEDESVTREPMPVGMGVFIIKPFNIKSNT